MKPYPLLALLAVFLSSSCGGGSGGGSSTTGLVAEQVAQGLSFPTAIRIASDGEIIFTEKGGDVHAIVNGVLEPQPIFTVTPNTGSERGLLGLALDPGYQTNRFIYVLYTKANGTENTVVRFTNNLTGPNTTVIIPSLPANANHNGGRLEFGPDNKLYVTLGDVQDPANSQSDASPAGKVLRYNSDGSIPADNPIAGNPLYSKGHRNCFGLAIDQGSGQVFVSENGPECDDEVNRVNPNANYGWRPGQPCGDTDPSYVAPLVRFGSIIAPTGMTVGTGAYADSLLMASFSDARLRQIRLNGFPGGTLDSVEVIYTANGEQIIDVTMGPDGNPYIATSNRILRLVPG